MTVIYPQIFILTIVTYIVLRLLKISNLLILVIIISGILLSFNFLEISSSPRPTLGDVSSRLRCAISYVLKLINALSAILAGELLIRYLKLVK